jgi:serine/threonine-protein kinase
MFTRGKNFGHYRVQSAIGEGGMGVIYRARDTRLKRDVAIKVLPARYTKDSTAVQRFIREAHAVSALNHPNILTIYDIGENENIHFIATEFVEGETLRRVMEKGPLSLEKTLDIALQSAAALKAAHDAGIIHRDIKPENIMIRTDGYVKILDFGIAKLTEQVLIGADGTTVLPATTLPGMILGTVSYMSPEQARGLEVDARTDIFSLGVVIYEMISGRLPFSGQTISDVIASILKSEPKPISQIVKNLPSELEWSVNKCLTKNIDERYQTMEELCEDLKRLKLRLEIETEFGISRDSMITVSDGSQMPLSEQATRILNKNHLTPARKTRTRKAIDSLAVLPLINDSGDVSTEYFSDGITECIINSLSKLPKLRVVPRSTVFRYKGRETDLEEVGRELDVRAVFAGRVQQFGDSLVVKAELVDVANEAQIWGEQYRREITDVFTLLDDIAEDISEKLRIKLTSTEKRKLTKRYTKNTEAYQFYLKGRYFVTVKRTENWIKKGIEYFKKAIDIDPNYALAYSGMAEAYAFLASSTGGWAPRKAFPKAKSAALKALELDDALSEAHCTLGFAELLYDWDFEAAKREFEKSIKLKPNYAGAHDGLGFYFKVAERHTEAIEKCKQVLELDPLSTFAHVSLGYAFYFARDFYRVIDESNKALEMDKYSAFAYRNLGLAYLQLNKIENAINALCKAVTFSSGSLAFEAYLGFAYAVAGKKAKAIETLNSFQKEAETRYVPAYNFAIINMGLGEIDTAIDWMEKAYKERSGFIPFLKIEPMLDPLRGHEHFQKIIERIDFPQ